jgi:hypothetical protein
MQNHINELNTLIDKKDTLIDEFSAQSKQLIENDKTLSKELKKSKARQKVNFWLGTAVGSAAILLIALII